MVSSPQFCVLKYNVDMIQYMAVVSLVLLSVSVMARAYCVEGASSQMRHACKIITKAKKEVERFNENLPEGSLEELMLCVSALTVIDVTNSMTHGGVLSGQCGIDVQSFHKRLRRRVSMLRQSSETHKKKIESPL